MGEKYMSIYLDNAATTKPCKESVDAALKCMVEDYGNPSSLHKLGLNAELHITEARKSIANAFSCDATNIFFTSGATESNNTAIIGLAQRYGKRKKKIVTTTIEHPSVAEPINFLEEHGFNIIRVAPDKNGLISADDIINAVDEDTCFISCMYVNNETGLILPIKKA